MLNESFYCENAPLRGHDHIVIDMCTFYNERKITLVIRHLGKKKGRSLTWLQNIHKFFLVHRFLLKMMIFHQELLFERCRKES
jgi:hypothetical protein